MKVRDGLGVYKYNNLDIYLGNWNNNNPDTSLNECIYLYNNGEIYIGRLNKKNCRDYGKYLYKNGDIYIG